jgi:hypothetical protein
MTTYRESDNKIDPETAAEVEGEKTLEEHSIGNNSKEGDTDKTDAQIAMIEQKFSVFELKRGCEDKKNLQLDPEFQRNTLWVKDQKSELIESILMGIPIPNLYFFEDEKGYKQVVDGRQRLSCIFEYINGEFNLVKLDKLQTLNGKFFKDLKPQFQAKIEDYQFTVYSIKSPTPERIKFDIFDRVNRGGTKLNNQEMRNALYMGKSTQLLKYLSESDIFLQATQRGVSGIRMKDRYIILRYLAFYLWKTGQLLDKDGQIRAYKSDMDEFLADTMRHINNLGDGELENLKEVFSLAMQNCHDVLGDGAFRFDKAGDTSNRRPINMGLFESLGYLFSLKLPDSIDRGHLKAKILDLKNEMDQKDFFLGIIDSNIGVNYRFDEAHKIKQTLEND